MSQTRSLLRLRPASVVLAGLLLTVLVYLPGMSGGFVFDDYANIVLNEDLKLDEITVRGLLDAGWSGLSGPLKRPISMMTFALNYATSGEFPGAFKYTNLALHLLNGILLYFLGRLILQRHTTRPRINPATLAAVAAVVWLLHPIQLTSVLYVVQRMTSLAAFFSLAAMTFYCLGRRRLDDSAPGGWPLILVAAPAAVILGVFSKENAALTIPMIGVIEVCIFRFHTPEARNRKVLQALFAIAVIVPAIAAAAYVMLNPEFLADRYVGRPFTLIERLMTEARVLWFYLFLILVPALSRLGLHHDDFEISTSLFEPISTTPALAGVVGAAVVAVLLYRKAPMAMFAIAWFLVGHAMESTLIPLELVHEHRNYVPSIGVILAISYGFAMVLSDEENRRYRSILAAVVVVMCALLTTMRAGDWSDPVTLATIEARQHPNSFRAVYELGRIEFGLFKMTREQAHFDNALAALERSASLDENATAPLAALIKLAYARGLEPAPRWRSELLERYRNGVFHMAETRDLHQMVKCKAEQRCEIPAQEIMEFYTAALANPTLNSYSKAQLLIDLAVFYVNETMDLPAAMGLLDEAVELHPDEFGFRATRMQVYLMAGRYDEVRAELQQVRAVRVWRDHLTPPLDAIAGIETDLARLAAE